LKSIARIVGRFCGHRKRKEPAAKEFLNAPFENQPGGDDAIGRNMLFAEIGGGKIAVHPRGRGRKKKEIERVRPIPPAGGEGIGKSFGGTWPIEDKARGPEQVFSQAR